MHCGSRESPQSCGLEEDDLVEEEAVGRFETIKSGYTVTKGERFYSQGPLSMLEDFIIDITADFCPTHYLITEALLEKAELLLQGISSLEGRITELLTNDMRRQAALALFAAVQTMECVENSCLIGAQCDKNHPATHHGVGHVLRACLELLKLNNQSQGSSSRTVFPATARKYVYLLEGVYGPEDCDIIAIKSALA
jgi:hypothetical protein